MATYQKAGSTEQHEERHRSDFGSYKITPRDRKGLLITAEQKFMRADSLGEYFAPDYEPVCEEPEQTEDDSDNTQQRRGRGGRRTGFPWPRDPKKRLAATLPIIYRWQDKMHLAEIWQKFAGQPPWVRLNQAGLIALGLPWTEILFPQNWDKLWDDEEHHSHIHHINQVRLSLARGDVKEVPNQHTWHSEREIEANLPAKEAGVRLPHRPDGYVEFEADWTWELPLRGGTIETIPVPRGCRAGIEVELSRKGFERLGHHVLPDLLEHYDIALYFCFGEAYDAVVSARRDYLQTDDQRKRIRILRLE